MITDIFIKTCNHDVPYHKYCIQSIDKFCTGFRDTVVLNDEHPRGYLWQQVCKMYADTRTNADMILVTDSDTIFVDPVTPESFMRDGKPIWFITPFASVSPDAKNAWFGVITKFLGEEPEYETMRRQPFMFPREVLAEFRKFCVGKHGVTIEEYVFREGSFSEYNCLGNFCLKHYPELFCWINTDIECPPAKVLQMWSHAPISQNMETINRILQ
jgi:hypothetical protein